jgi:hypothetical protein
MAWDGGPPVNLASGTWKSLLAWILYDFDLFSMAPWPWHIWWIWHFGRYLQMLWHQKKLWQSRGQFGWFIRDFGLHFVTKGCKILGFLIAKFRFFAWVWERKNWKLSRWQDQVLECEVSGKIFDSKTRPTWSAGSIQLGIKCWLSQT